MVSLSKKKSPVLDSRLDSQETGNGGILVYKGVIIEHLLPLGVFSNMPPFLGSSAQMPAEDVILTQVTASLCMHVERAVNKIKNFHIWDGVIPLPVWSGQSNVDSLCNSMQCPIKYHFCINPDFTQFEMLLYELLDYKLPYIKVPDYKILKVFLRDSWIEI